MDRISEESGVEWIVKKDEIFEYVQKQYGTLPEYLWSKLPDSAVPVSVSYTHLDVYKRQIRIHKSYLVNFQQIRKVGYTEVETKDGRILNISDTYKKDVLSLIHI